MSPLSAVCGKQAGNGILHKRRSVHLGGVRIWRHWKKGFHAYLWKAVESTGLLLNGWRTQRQQAQKQMKNMLSLTGSLLSGSVLRLSSSCTWCQSLGEWSTTHDKRKSVRMCLNKKMSPWNCTGYSWYGWGSYKTLMLKVLVAGKGQTSHPSSKSINKRIQWSNLNTLRDDEALSIWRWCSLEIKAGHPVHPLHRQLMPLKGKSKLL